MSNLNPNQNWKQSHPTLWALIQVLLVAGLLLLASIVYLSATTNLGALIVKPMSWLFATNSVQVMWYITRAAGLTAYMLVWFSTAWGLAVSTKILDRILPGVFTYDFHQFISLLAIGFIILHIGVLMADRYLPYSLAQVLVPFLSPYRPVWVGVGVITFYLTLLVSFTFYIRRRIGMKTFRTIHLLSFIAYLGATVHGFFSGTDSSLWTTQVMYGGTFLVIVFLTVFRIITSVQKRVSSSNTEPGKTKRFRSLDYEH